ncbi:hypothetical protein AJ88_12655 [Mesorhizobium amorphae CCBAU 01583]|nr:hypothetical protein AJ88_12655 [Mesorhizobium amorphae CCBAU 01583]
MDKTSVEIEEVGNMHYVRVIENGAVSIKGFVPRQMPKPSPKANERGSVPRSAARAKAGFAGLALDAKQFVFIDAEGFCLLPGCRIAAPLAAGYEAQSHKW